MIIQNAEKFQSGMLAHSNVVVDCCFTSLLLSHILLDISCINNPQKNVVHNRFARFLRSIPFVNQIMKYGSTLIISAWHIKAYILARMWQCGMPNLAPVAETGCSHRLTPYKIVGYFSGWSYLRLVLNKSGLK